MATYRTILPLLAITFFSVGCSNDKQSPAAHSPAESAPVPGSPSTENNPEAGAALIDAATLDSAASEPGTPDTDSTANANPENVSNSSVIYINDFSTEADGDRIDQFVAYRDPFVVNHTVGRSDHASTAGINCTAPDQTRDQTRANPSAHVYQCLPGGDAQKGHQMAFAMDTSGYGFVGALPDQVFEGIREVSVDINATTAGSRNFIEIKIIPADQVYVNAMPCIPDLPCNDGWDYGDINAVGAGTNSQEGTGLTIATPDQPDGYAYDHYNAEILPNGDSRHALCSGDEFCFQLATHETTTGIQKRFAHVFKDNGDGTVAFGIEQDGGQFTWVEAPGSFPGGAVRVVVAFHNYTGTKDGSGPGFAGNESPSTGGFTWHWDNLSVDADSSISSREYYGSTSAERIITPSGCVAFAQGQRTLLSNTDVAPMLHCNGDIDIEL